MTLNEYQALAQRTSRKDISPDDHLFNGILGLAGETGECADLVKRYLEDGKTVETTFADEEGAQNDG